VVEFSLTCVNRSARKQVLNHLQSVTVCGG